MPNKQHFLQTAYYTLEQLDDSLLQLENRMRGAEAAIRHGSATLMIRLYVKRQGLDLLLAKLSDADPDEWEALQATFESLCGEVNTANQQLQGLLQPYRSY